MACWARLLGALLVLALPAGVAAQQTVPAAQQVAPAAPAAAPQTQTPEQVKELLRLLDDPSVRTWLETQRSQPSTTAPAKPSLAAEEATVADRLNERMDQLESHFDSVLAAIPTLPQEAANAYGRLQQELRGVGLLKVTILLAGFSLLGFGLEQLFWRVTARLRAAAAERPEVTLGHRLRSVMTRLAIGTASVVVFGIGSIGAFLIFAWPPLLREIVLGYLVAFLVVRLVLEIGRVLLLPAPRESEDPTRHRVIPATTPDAQFWHRRLVIAAAYFAVCWATLQLLSPLGVSPNARIATAHLLGLGLVGLGLEIVWRRPRPADMSPHDERRRTAWNAILSVYIVLLAALWVIGASGLLSLGLVILLLPGALSITQSAVDHLLRPAEHTDAGVGDAVPPGGRQTNDGLLGVFLERGLRVALIVASVLILADAWNVDLIAMARGGESTGMRIARGALSIVVILLLADLLWELLKAAIDRKLAVVPAEAGTETAVRQARLRTLLPIFRNIALVVIAGCATLMTLSELGVEIGPLIAGAGVVGVAIGFGAQTVVKDIISGVFYLLDDAFRIGEYIQSGSYTGVVEGFSLRSVKLRAPRGPIFTVPFGQLGAVENLSRDWAIDKFQIGITYDSDLEKARKLIKKVGEELKADPEIGPSIIEPLKMQGVQEFGTFAIQIRLKMTTKPGEQTTIRRKAYSMIKKAFDANGINFAFPTVQVAGGADSANAKPAVANQVLELLQPPKQAEG